MWRIFKDACRHAVPVSLVNFGKLRHVAALKNDSSHLISKSTHNMLDQVKLFIKDCLIRYDIQQERVLRLSVANHLSSLLDRHDAHHPQFVTD